MGHTSLIFTLPASQASADFQKGLIRSKLSRLGRSLGQVLQIVATLIERKIRFIAIKEGIEVNGKQDLRTRKIVPG